MSSCRGAWCHRGRRRPADRAACRSPCRACPDCTSGVGIAETADVAGVFDRRPLEAVADPEVGMPRSRARVAARIMPRVPRSPKPPGTRIPSAPSSSCSPPACSSASASTQRMFTRSRCLKPPAQRACSGSCTESVADILADDVDRDLVGGMLDPIHEIDPASIRASVSRKALQQDPIEPLSTEHQRHLVDARHVLGRDHGLLVDVTEERDLALDVLIQESIGPAEQDVGLDPDRPQIAHAASAWS